ncbi:MBL fold metallo-hydrolase [Oceanobacillus salinisoli]|uniref:MBL fold metallo-hydrolase n=1 Tax=Oceanobacillus salinisoli TaxID=2678611 RepID=UPI0012E1EECF|nr:MBL fold metallo-hydrolase [Oceanobacillus salinisoli]
MLSQITDHIHKLVVTFPMGMGDVNSYLIEGKKGYTVIDTGANLKEAMEIWQRFLDSGITLEKVVITHTHEDHVGLAKWFQETIGVPVIIPKLGLTEMEKRRNLTVEQFNQLITKFGGPGLPEHFRDDTSIFDFIPDDTFDNHQEIQLGDDMYETIWTPGHAYDQFCFYNKEKNIMIVGDHILKEVSPVIGLWNGEEQNPLRDYLKSLEIIKEYSPDIALPGHGDSIYHFQDRVVELQDRHEHRLEQAYEAVKYEYKTAKQVTEEIYGTLNIIIELSALMATITRFLYLEDIGKIERKVSDGKVLFRASNSL